MSLVDRIGVGSIAPEKLVAIGAAVIAGAAVYLMPQNVLQEAVIASGLPSVLPPLEPPLGGKARIGLALFAAGTVFGMITTLLRLIARFGDRPAKPLDVATEQAVEVPAAPKLRRRDRHPDAPPRMPLLIEKEIGAPVEDAPIEEEPAPVIRSGREATQAEEIEEVEEPVAAAAVELPEPEQVSAPEPEMEEQTTGRRPSWLDPSAAHDMPPAGPPPALVELVERLERALAAKSMPRSVPAPVQPRATVEPEPEAEVTDTRLRAALESLKRFAPQRG